MRAADFRAELVIALGAKFHDRKTLRRKLPDHLDAVANRRRENIRGIVQIEARIESWNCRATASVALAVAPGRRSARPTNFAFRQNTGFDFADFEKAEF